MCNGTPSTPRTAPGPNLSPASADVETRTDTPATATILTIARPTSAWHLTVLRLTCIQIHDQISKMFQAVSAPAGQSLARPVGSAAQARGVDNCRQGRLRRA